MKLKMFGKKSVSAILFYSARLITIGYTIFILFVIISLITHNFVITDNNDMEMQIPFSTAVIKGDFTSMTLIAMLGFLIFYGVFFFMLSLIFKTFSAEKLFTEKAIKHLKWFTILNLVLPFVYPISAIILKNRISMDDLAPGLLHIGLGIFAWFIVAIFRLGFTIQEENELTI